MKVEVQIGDGKAEESNYTGEPYQLQRVNRPFSQLERITNAECGECEYCEDMING